MNKLTWRLSKLPTPEELRELVKDKIITQEEARNVLFNEQTEESTDIDSLKSEIKFLRELVDKLSDKQTITRYIETVIPRYNTYTWAHPYQYYCGAGSATGNGLTSTTAGGNSATSLMNTYSAGLTSLSDVQTF